MRRLQRRGPVEDASQGVPRRVHTEDLAQAVGAAAAHKYAMTAPQALALIGARIGVDAQYGFVRMLAFNTAVGNADAHAKNYSIVLDRGVRLAPLYDSLPTTVWPQVSDDRLAIPIAGAVRAQGVQVGNWAKLALDPDRVAAIATDVARLVRDRAHDTYRDAGVSQPMLTRIDHLIETTTRQIAPRHQMPGVGIPPELAFRADTPALVRKPAAPNPEKRHTL